MIGLFADLTVAMILYIAHIHTVNIVPFFGLQIYRNFKKTYQAG